MIIEDPTGESLSGVISGPIRWRRSPSVPTVFIVKYQDVRAHVHIVAVRFSGGKQKVIAWGYPGETVDQLAQRA